MRWFRFYEDTLNNPKVQRLQGEVFKTWANMLCIASANDGHVPAGEDLAFALRMPVAKAEAFADQLLKVQLLERDGDGYRPHDWNDWQYASDSSAERMRRHRQRKRDGGSDGGVTSPTPSPTPSPSRHGDVPDTDSDSEAEQKNTDAPASVAPVAEPQLEIPAFMDRRKTDASRGTRIDPNWQPSAEDRAFAADLGFTNGTLEPIIAEFRDYWLGESGQRARKVNWSSTFRNRVRDRAERRGAVGGSNRPAAGREPPSFVAAVAADLARTRGEG